MVVASMILTDTTIAIIMIGVAVTAGGTAMTVSEMAEEEDKPT